MSSLPDSGSEWIACMRRGDFTAAWEISDAVLQRRRGASCRHLPRHLQYVWDGTPLDDKRVLVRCYHGLGDTIQFVRFLPMLKRRGCYVTLWVQPELMGLLNSAEGIDDMLPLHDGAPEAAYEVDVEIMELTHALRITPDTLPRRVPYLHVAGAAPMERRDGCMHVGLVWQAGDWDERRSIPYDAVRRLARVPDVVLHVLQRGPALSQREETFGVLSGSDDILEVARVMRALDLVITVDSMPAHLAGASGIPVWTLLHADADWRWMAEGEETPWYPTMRLIRQKKPGDWNGVIDNVAASLLRVARQAV